MICGLACVLLAGCGSDEELGERAGEEVKRRPQVSSPGKTPADAVAYPATIAIFRNDTFVCAGALIEPTVAIATRDCVVSGTSARYTIGFGRTLQSTVRTPVDKVVTQEGGEGRLSLLRMRSALKGSKPLPVIGFIPVEQRRYDRKTSPSNTGWGHLLEIAGYGETRNGARNGGTLRVAISKFVKVGASTDLMVLGERPDGQGPCRGDEGSPAFDLKLGTWYLHGLKWGPLSGCETNTHVYVELSSHLSWIGSAKAQLNAP